MDEARVQALIAQQLEETKKEVNGVTATNGSAILTLSRSAPRSLRLCFCLFPLRFFQLSSQSSALLRLSSQLEVKSPGGSSSSPAADAVPALRLRLEHLTREMDMLLTKLAQQMADTDDNKKK